MIDGATWPARILSEVDWRFWDEEPYTDRQAFDAAVAAWHARGDDEPHGWRPAEVVLRAPRVRIKYFGVNSPDDDEYENFTAEVASDDGAFSAGELLFKIHNAVVERLNAVDHCYFESLTLDEDESTPDLPVYEMTQGS